MILEKYTDTVHHCCVIQVDAGAHHLRAGNYFSHLSRQPEQLKLLMGARFAGSCNLVKSWEMGSGSFYRHPLSWHYCVHFLMCLSCYSHWSACHFTNWNVSSGFVVLPLNNLEKSSQIRWGKKKKIRVAYLIATAAAAHFPFNVSWPRFTQV